MDFLCDREGALYKDGQKEMHRYALNHQPTVGEAARRWEGTQQSLNQGFCKALGAVLFPQRRSCFSSSCLGRPALAAEKGVGGKMHRRT